MPDSKVAWNETSSDKPEPERVDNSTAINLLYEKAGFRPGQTVLGIWKNQAHFDSWTDLSDLNQGVTNVKVLQLPSNPFLNLLPGFTIPPNVENAMVIGLVLSEKPNFSDAMMFYWEVYSLCLSNS